MEIQWDVLSGPIALVTVNDKVCVDCSTELVLDPVATPSEQTAFTTFLDTTIVEDPTQQDWTVVNNQCISPGESVCEILTAKITRTWSSFVATEDLSFSNGQFMI